MPQGKELILTTFLKLPERDKKMENIKKIMFKSLRVHSSLT